MSNIYAADFTQVMANVWYVIPMFVHVHWCESVMSVTMAPIKEDALFVGDLVFQMLTTVKSVPSVKKM